MGGPQGSLTPLEVKALFSTFQLIQHFGCIYSSLLSKARQRRHFTIHKCTSDTIARLLTPKTLQNGNFPENRGACARLLAISVMISLHVSLHFKRCASSRYTCNYGEPVVWIGSIMVSK